MDISKYRQQLFKQKEILENTSRQLKSEFIGIDTVIDQITDAINSWFFFPEMQERPVIINLWGLTGTGKTSLVKRLSELLGFSDRYFRFDLGESGNSYYGIQDTFKDIYESSNGDPFIIGLDEFQHARTINEDNEEVNKASSRAVWDLLDTGKFDMIDFEYNTSWFNRLIKSLDLALNRGVEVEHGIIVNGKAIYNEIMTTTNQDEDESEVLNKTYFISDQNVNTIFDLVDFMFVTKSDLREKLNEMDGEETLAYLIYLFKKSLRPKNIDCTRALVFVMGNLDEVYSMTRNFNPDMSANEFHYESTRITVTQVKEALLTRFRSEQIARLGNTHIIYPAFNEDNFYNIIRLELEKVRRKVQDTYQLNLTFDKCTESLIYEEGVFPTQGTRPLFTTIHQIVNTRLGKILNEIYLNGFLVDSVHFSVDETAQTDHATLLIDFINNRKIIHRLTDKYALVLGKLRKPRHDDEQAIVAVHESGHAILSTILMKTLPNVVFSVTADSSSDGFVFARPEWNYISRKEIINRLAVLLGGLVAERIIFGEENVTIGSSTDINRATQLAIKVLYTCGMGNTRAYYGNQHTDRPPGFILDNHSDGINKQAEELIFKAEELAQQTLEKQKTLLIRMADYLSDNRSADKNKIREFVEKHAVDFDLSTVVENGENVFYRQHLKKLAGE
ncbi:AAA family ATPase [Bacteroides sp. 519]|uniref:AAA family ATPase n=1 Tax=Bacteroides sp. 519 TaxID=2302937 RepID=UPI0013D29A10|nr:AAA family ATPase [Bacteroides sp. 519]NDV57762.1 AAA family ATPase [Bacteroides sp. 519]